MLGHASHRAQGLPGDQPSKGPPCTLRWALLIGRPWSQAARWRLSVRKGAASRWTLKKLVPRCPWATAFSLVRSCRPKLNPPPAATSRCHALLERGELERVWVGRSIRIPAASLEAFLARGGAEARPVVPGSRPYRRNRNLPAGQGVAGGVCPDSSSGTPGSCGTGSVAFRSLGDLGSLALRSLEGLGCSLPPS